MLFQKNNKINVGRKHSEETKRKISEAHKKNPIWKGKKFSKEHLRKLSEAHKGLMVGPNNPMYGKHPSEETRKKLSKIRKGRRFSEEHRKKLSLAMIGNKRMLGRTGEKCPAWRGGITSIVDKIRSSYNYKQWRKLVFERDDYTCQFCRQRSGKIEVDHIIPFSKIIEKLKFEQGIDNLFEKAMNYPLLWDINNGRTLCKSCHKKTDTYAGRANIY